MLERSNRPRVLLPTFEFGPLRVGGLHSFMESFVGAVRKLGVEPVVVLPSSGMASAFAPPHEIQRDSFAEVLYTSHEGTEVILLKNDLLDGSLYPEDPADLTDPMTLAAWEYSWMQKVDVFGMVLAKCLPRLGLDVLHLQDAFAWRALLAARHLELPSLLTVHLLHDDIAPFHFAEHTAVRMCDRTIAVSPSYMKEHSEFFDIGSSLAITNGIDPKFWDLDLMSGSRDERRESLLREHGLSDGRLIVTAGRVVEGHKGMDVLAEALSRWDDWGDARFLLLGEGEPAAIARFVELAERRPGQVAVTAKHCSRDYVRRCFSAADATVIPSRFEPFGLTQVEAMAMGAIPLVSSTGGLKDVNVSYEEDAGFGATFAPGDSGALLATLEEFLSVGARRCAVLRENARRAAAKRTVATCAAAYVEEYRKLAPESFSSTPSARC